MLAGDKCAEQDGKPVLEFIAVRRMDNNSWALPGVDNNFSFFLFFFSTK